MRTSPCEARGRVAVSCCQGSTRCSNKIAQRDCERKGLAAEAHQRLGVVAVSRDDVPIAALGQVLGGVQAEAAGRAGDDDGLLTVWRRGGGDRRAARRHSLCGRCSRTTAVSSSSCSARCLRHALRHVLADHRDRGRGLSGVDGSLQKNVCTRQRLGRIRANRTARRSHMSTECVSVTGCKIR